MRVKRCDDIHGGGGGGVVAVEIGRRMVLMRLFVAVVVVVVVVAGLRFVVVLAEDERADHAERAAFGQVGGAHVAAEAARVVEGVARAHHQLVGVQHLAALGAVFRSEQPSHTFIDDNIIRRKFTFQFLNHIDQSFSKFLLIFGLYHHLSV